MRAEQIAHRTRPRSRSDPPPTVIATLLAVVFVDACSSDETEKQTGTGGAAGAGGTGAGTPGIEPLPAGWNKMQPGGRTLCARGDPWEYYVRPGKTNKVLVYLQGGGACFDFVSCLPTAKIFVD